MKEANWSRIVGIACALVVGVGCADEEKPAVELGRLHFAEPRTPTSSYSCATCHRAAPDPSDDRILPGAVLAGAHERPSYWQGQERDLLRSINHCRNLFMAAEKPWTRDDESAKALYAYILSLAPPVVEPVPFTVVGPIADLPPGPAERGADIYRRACQSCHGAAHTAAGRLVAGAPVLPEQTLAVHANYTVLEKRLVFVEKVRHGIFLGYAGFMPPFSREVLSDEDLAALLTFLGLYQ
jgi:thiosulfate dehydrogenase